MSVLFSHKITDPFAFFVAEVYEPLVERGKKIDMSQTFETSYAIVLTSVY